jgi:phosphoribosyl-dephospho-CoA transferase
MTVRRLPARHDLVWLAPGWRAALVAPLEPAVAPVLEDWVARGRPLVACRRDGLGTGELALAAALAPVGPLRRARIAVRRAAVARVAPPPALADVLPSTPFPWRSALAALDRDARAAGLMVRVYGSLLWRHLTGEPHLTATSDVDLLVRVRTAGELGRALALLEARAAQDDPRLDGELVLPGGRGVAWRELAARPARILVKSSEAVELVRLGEALS